MLITAVTERGIGQTIVDNVPTMCQARSMRHSLLPKYLWRTIYNCPVLQSVQPSMHLVKRSVVIAPNI